MLEPENALNKEPTALDIEAVKTAPPSYLAKTFSSLRQYTEFEKEGEEPRDACHPLVKLQRTEVVSGKHHVTPCIPLTCLFHAFLLTGESEDGSGGVGEVHP
jgi:hypothetical protein